ncbi:MAG: AbrB/MazE/SpoVT family DNA-binding domain-containing protein [Pyrinomonadaceae bacterium]
MGTIRSKITAQGQISVPARIRQKLGLGPGSVIEWEEHGDEVVVKRATLYTLEDLHKSLFPKGPPRRRSLRELKEGIKKYVRDRHARR